MIPKCIHWLLSENAVEAVVQMLNSTCSARPDDVFKQGSILEASLECLQSLAKSERKVNTKICNLASSTVSAVFKKYPDLPDSLSEGAELICVLATLPANVPTLQSSSIAKALINAAKSNPSHIELQTRTAKALTLMSINNDIATTITRSGAARVLLASVDTMDGCDIKSARCAEVVGRMIGTLSDFTGSLKTLHEQNVLKMLCSNTHKFGWDSEVSQPNRAWTSRNGKHCSFRFVVFDFYSFSLPCHRLLLFLSKTPKTSLLLTLSIYLNIFYHTLLHYYKIYFFILTSTFFLLGIECCKKTVNFIEQRQRR